MSMTISQTFCLTAEARKPKKVGLSIYFTVPENHLMINPYYVLGLYHFPLLVSEENLQNGQWKYENLFHFASLGEDENTRGRENIGVYPVWVSMSLVMVCELYRF